LHAIICGHVAPKAIMQTDGWRGKNSLAYIGYDKHFRVQHNQKKFARAIQHLNSIESLWSYAGGDWYSSTVCGPTVLKLLLYEFEDSLELLAARPL
jgi:hypothetical protein